MSKILTVLLAAVGFSATALAQGLPSFEEVDTNLDGTISQEEAAAVEALDFASVDANQDGAIDREEYSQVSGQE